MPKNNLPTIERKTLLYKSNVEYADWCINHIEGCGHGCKFPCYAFLMAKRFGKVKSYEDWIKPKIVANALELLDKEIPKYKKKIKVVHLCFTTDPFMYQYPEVEELTLKIIKKLNASDIRVTTLTKGVYPKVLKDTARYSKNNEYGITLVSLNKDFKSRCEPFSAPYTKRIKGLQMLSDAGAKTWVSMEPYPAPNIDPTAVDLTSKLETVSFADKIIFGKLNYNLEVTQSKDSADFYERCAEIVRKFCKNRGIDYHIKFGTQQIDNEQTSEIFVEAPTVLQPVQLQVAT